MGAISNRCLFSWALSGRVGLGSAFRVMYLVAQSQRWSHLSSLGDKKNNIGGGGEEKARRTIIKILAYGWFAALLELLII